jgi:Ion transport protein
MLIYFIFAILGTFLFRRITTGNVINEQFNFSNFGMSLLVVIRMSTGEDWNYVMQDTMKTPADGCIPNATCGISYAPVFFIPLMMLCTFIMLNLFILVIIQQFEMY